MSIYYNVVLLLTEQSTFFCRNRTLVIEKEARAAAEYVSCLFLDLTFRKTMKLFEGKKGKILHQQ